MSYDINLIDPVTRNVIEFDEKHSISGGTNRAWLNVTYNYSQIFHRVLGDGGIRSLYGKTGAEAIPNLEKAIASLKDDTDPDYCAPTEGNAKESLKGLLQFAKMKPDGIFEGN